MADLASATGLSMRQLYRLFGSRPRLLRDREPAPGARERILGAALELLGRGGLADLSTDEVAERANGWRATLYRLIPGKSALFRELVAASSPWEPIAAALDRRGSDAGDRPEQVIP